MATSEQFMERWKSLTHPRTTANERAGNYTVLTSYLKESGVDPSFTKELCRHQQSLLKRIMTDITCKSCDHAALQVLGYCLHNIEFASKFNKDQANTTIKGLCDVILSRTTEKSVCTRALWCLTNQQLSVDYLISHVTSIVSMATEVITVHHVGVATVNSEALNLLIRFGEQFPPLFAKLVTTWYKAVVELITCKVHKVQQKALSLAVRYESHLHGNHDITHWLTKALKERVVSVMLSQLTEKGLDHTHLLKSWAHFVTVLGKTLHKHGSFLNELLRIVETGFKHRSPSVQVAAYDAWRILITNFSLDLTVMVSQKRLKLLLMPLLASAVRERHETVEQARIRTWWHLIGCLGQHKASQFQNVCVPFLMLCLGLDPKSDISQLAETISGLHSHSTKSDSNSTSSAPQTPKSTGTIHLAVTPTPSASSAQSSAVTPTSSIGPGRLLSTVNTPRSRRGVEIEKGKKGSDRYQTPPNIAMVMTGCHALLKFTGCRDKVPQSLIESEIGQYVVFPKSIVPMETANFMLLFLDSLLTYSTQLYFKEKGVHLDKIIYHILSVIICSVEAEDGLSSTIPSSAALLVTPLVDLLTSGSLNEHVGRETTIKLLSHLIGLPPRLLTSSRSLTSDSWKKLSLELLKATKADQTSDWFTTNWHKLTDMIASSSQPLTNFLFLSKELNRLIKEGDMDRDTCSKLWTSLAKKLTSFISQTSQVNNGTSLDPSFETIRHVLKFPFLNLLDHGERSPVTHVMELWKNLYEMANVHMGLVVKETNLCTEIVCSDLYAAYGQYMKLESGSIEQKHQVLRFDLYQNAVASALSYIVSKIKWATLDQPLTSRPLTSGPRKERVKSMETLLSLLAWQLAVFWDTAKKGPLLLSQLTTPYTLLDLVESLYHHISTSSLLTMATEMIGQPLATLFEAVLSSSVALSNSHRCSKLTQHDLELRVEKVWKAITICFQARHVHPYNSTLLSTLSPLLVATLNSSSQQLCTLSLSFWAVTFDKSQKLDYPARLRDYFMKYLKDIKQPSELKLPGLRGNHKMLTSAQKDLVEDTAPITQSEVIQFSETQSHSQIQNQDPDVTTDSVVLPNPSPRKGVCGSFLNRKAPSSPYKPRPTPSSPQAKQLDEILARATTSVEKVQSSPLRVMGVAGGNKEGSPLASARRRLDLGNNTEDYVAVGPPQKKRRLLTEHQKEVMKERKSDLPTLYNALDPTLDSAPMSIPTQDVQLEEDAPVISESKNQQSTSSRPEPPVSIPNSIPDSHSTTGSKTASPTSRDTPITIPDSPPLTPTSTSTQPPVSMVTSATVRTSVNPSPVTLPTNTTVPELHPLASPPATHVPQYFHVPLPPGQVMPHPPTGPLSPPPFPPTAYPTVPLPHPHTTVSIPSAFPTSHITMTTGSAFNPPPHHVLATNPFHRSHGIPVIITQPGHGSMIQYIPTNKAGMVHSGPAPTAVAPPTMVPPLVVSQPTAPQLVSQSVQSVLPPESRPHLPHAVNIGGVLVTSRGPPTLPTYCEALSLKAMEEAFSQSSREASEQRRKRPQRTMATREKTTREERGKTQRQLPNEASKGEAPVNQGHATVEGHSKASVAIQTSSNQPLTSTSAVPIPVSSTATATPTSASVSTSSSNSSSFPPSSKSSARTEEKSHEPVQGFTSEKEVPLSDKLGSDGAVRDEEGAGKKMEDDVSPELMEVGGALSSEDDIIEESEDPLSGVRKKKVRKNDKEGEKEQGGEREGVFNQSCRQTEIKVQPGQKDGQMERESHELNKSEVKGTSESDTVQTSDSKPDEVQPNSTDSTKVAVDDQTTSGSNVSSGGRKSLSLRRHSSSSTAGDAGIGGGEKEEGGGARKASLVDTPTNGKGGILKHTSQFDTPSTAKAGRRVQFAAKNVFHEPDSQKQKQSGGEEEEHKTVTPKHSRGLRTPQGPFSSRRTLLMSQTPPKMILVSKPHPPATPTQNSGPVYPSLKDCQSPVEQILPALSPSSKFTHGLLQLVSAQNITTVGSISSLSEQEVQTLPIKSPKVLTLRGALRSFEQQLQGSKRKSSFDGESGLATPPPRKQARLDFDLSSSTTTKDAVGVSDGKACEVSAESADEKKTKEQEQDGDKGKEETVRGEREEQREGERERKEGEGGEREREEGEGENTRAALASQLTEEEHYTESEELSEVSHDLGGPIMTLCTPESQLTPPGDHAGDGGDADDTSDGDIGDVDEGPTAKCEGEEVKGMLESEAKDDEEEMDVEENQNSAVETVLPDSPPESPPTATPLAQAPPTATSSPSTQNSSVSHDHTYCSQTVETDATPNQSRSKKGEKNGTKERERRVGDPGSSMLSMMVHDHTYCSQRKEASRSNSAHPTASSSDSKEKGRGGEGERDERESRSKLSLMVHDHTYCSRQRRDPCLEETASPALQDGGEERETAIKRGERETREDTMAEGSGVGEKTDTSEATRDDTGMEIGKMDESEGIEFDTSMDSDVLAEGGSTSSQSQELFSQDTSQVQDNGTNAPPTTTPTAPPASEPCRVSHGEEEEQTVAEGREGIAVAKGNDINSADSAKIVESGHVEEIKDKEKDEGEEEGGETKMKEKRPMAETKCLVPSHSVSTGSNGSSSSSNFSNIAECSQRPSSLDHAPLPATDSSSSSDQESSETSKFLDALSQLKDLSEQVNVMMDQKASLSREELIACRKTAGPVATSAQKFFQALMQHFT